MHLDEDTAKERLESPNNLANRFGARRTIPPVVNESIDGSESDTELDRVSHNELDPTSNNDKSAAREYPTEITTVVERQKKKLGRKNGVPSLPVFMRTTAAVLAHVDSQKNVAEQFGVSQAEVGNYKNGNVEANQPAIDKALGDIKDLAVEKTMMALGLLTPEKVEKAKARDIAGIAKDMSTIIEKVSPKQDATNKEVVLVLYAPQVKSERGYNVVTVSADD